MTAGICERDIAGGHRPPLQSNANEIKILVGGGIRI